MIEVTNPRRYQRYLKDEEVVRRLIYLYKNKNDHTYEGYMGSYTTVCSGCLELGDYGTVLYSGGFDPKTGMVIGAGCRECGYTGKRRHTVFIPFTPCPHCGAPAKQSEVINGWLMCADFCENSRPSNPNCRCNYGV